MIWFKNWLKDLVKDAVQEAREEEEGYRISEPQLARESDGLGSHHEPQLNFRVYSAIGGKVVEFVKHDRFKGRIEHQTYIITNDQDFGERIAKIATLENLKD